MNVQQQQVKQLTQWSTGLCDCFADVEICIITCFCPLITFGWNAEIIDKGSKSCVESALLYGVLSYFTGCQCIYGYPYRAKLRAQYSLPESPCGDCPVHRYCELCALCQEYRELKNRGFDVKIGWQGNMEKMGGEVKVVPPPVLGVMSR